MEYKKFYSARAAALSATSITDQWQNEDGEHWNKETLIEVMDCADGEYPLDESMNPEICYVVDPYGAVGYTEDNGCDIYWYVTPVKKTVPDPEQTFSENRTGSEMKACSEIRFSPEEEEKTVFCRNCGNKLPAFAMYCDRCGAEIKSEPSASYEDMEHKTVTVPADAPQDYGKKSYHPDLVGFSTVKDRPEILAFKEKTKKGNLGCLVFFAFIPVTLITVMVITGLFTGDNDAEFALYAFGFGVVLTLILLFISYLLHLRSGREKSAWEGVVIDKKKKKHRDRHAEKHHSDQGNIYYTYYSIHVRTDQGKKESFGQSDSTELYNYFKIGDRVRYHPVLEYYEKYDKSHDNYIFCACCKCRNPIGRDTCKKCGMPLFK